MKIIWIFFLMVCFLSSKAYAGDFNIELHGYGELRAGYRIYDDEFEKDASVAEARGQLETSVLGDFFDFKYKVDFWGDGVANQIKYDTRELHFFIRPNDFMDIKIGRQVLTWGTGDLVFLNDLFPKDWRSFFIGRNVEYLKAPSDAAKLSFFNDIANIDLVYTPQFDSDRFITGKYVSYWNKSQNKIAGENAIVTSHKPSCWFEDDEVNLRIYKNIKGYELAAYFYDGFWKTPYEKEFHRLRDYGLSFRGQVGKGIGNVEVAYYQSLDDESGKNPDIHNSQVKYLIGYTQEIGKDLNLSVQHYVEHMLNYNSYIKNLKYSLKKDEFRHVTTMQLIKLLINQNLKLVFASYYSLTDKDSYLRPSAQYNLTDSLVLEAGANIFLGESKDSSFSQYQDNTNIYSSIRYNF